MIKLIENNNITHKNSLNIIEMNNNPVYSNIPNKLSPSIDNILKRNFTLQRPNKISNKNLLSNMEDPLKKLSYVYTEVENKYVPTDIEIEKNYLHFNTPFKNNNFYFDHVYNRKSSDDYTNILNPNSMGN